MVASGSCDWGFHRGHDWPRPGGGGREGCVWRVWDVASGTAGRVVRGEGLLLSVAFSPDGKLLACGMGDEARVYDVDTETAGQVVARHDAGVTSVAFTPDGGSLLSAGHDQTVERTNLSSGTVEWRLPGYFEQVNSVALSTDGSLLVTGTSDHRFARGRIAAGRAAAGAVRVWDARTGRMLRRLRGAAEQVMAVAVSPDGRRIAAGGANGAGAGGVGVWDPATGEAVWSVSDLAKVVLAVAFSPDGRSLASASADGAVVVRDAGTGNVARAIEAREGGVTSLVFSPDGRVLYCGEARGGTSAWDARSGRAVRAFQAARPDAESFTIDRLMNCVALSRDGGVLAACASSVNGEFVDPVRIWDARTGSVVREFGAENIHGRPMALSPDGSIIATGGKSVRLWDARSGKLLRDLIGHLKRTQSIVFSADGRMLVAGGSYGTTNLWEVGSGRLLVTLFAYGGERDGAVVDDWFAYQPEGYYDGSEGVERYLAWRVGEEVKTPATMGRELRRPDVIEGALGIPLPPAGDR